MNDGDTPGDRLDSLRARIEDIEITVRTLVQCVGLLMQAENIRLGRAKKKDV